MCIRDRLNIDEMPSVKIALIKENSSKIISYCMTTRKKEELKIDGYTAPMNYSSVDTGKLMYVIGGNRTNHKGFNTFLDDFVSISVAEGLHHSLRPLKAARRRAAAVHIEGKCIYVMGGDRGADFLNTCERFNIEKQEWSACASLSEGKTNASAGVFRGKVIYLFGGYNSNAKDLKSIERLDTEGGAGWERADVATNCIGQNMGVVQISYNEMLLFGGMQDTVLLPHSFIFKVEEKKLEKMEDMKKAESFITVGAKLFGFNVAGIGSHFNDLHLFNVKTKKWTMVEYSSK
eukprot:TRINITY_DN12754_c0_g1_i3.p1 TRINITY_DN12754_c0_g1~~TRINITY_DN12754_c0_g1_i3.p1  ORF type:complete len:290 (-),score=77.76 TRINITY_DN12754_c0_g1_i3:128-997(-)